MNHFKNFIIGVLLCCFSLLLGQQPAYAFNFGQIVGAAADYAHLKKELSYYNTDGRDELGSYLREKNGVDDNQEKNELLNQIMNNLTNAISQTEKIDPQYKYFINQHEDFNAFCALGHNVSVNTGLFDFLNSNEDEIGFVLAHELVHGQKNHSIKAVDKAVPINILKSILSQQSRGGALLGDVAGNYLIAKQATLPDEWEADNIGFAYATNAGYNPGAGAAIWTKVLEKYGDNHRNFFGELMSPNDHPTNGQRINNYAKKLTEYSKGNVSYNPQTSYVIVKNKPWFKVAGTENQSVNERGYLIAGKLARVFHDLSTFDPASNADGNVMLGDYQLVSPNDGEDSAETAAQNLNDILRLHN